MMGGSRQHYLPQWYLRNFAIEEDLDKTRQNKKIYRLNKKNQSIELKKIKKSFVRNSFLSNWLDEELQKIENKVASVIGKIYRENPQLIARKIDRKDPENFIPNLQELTNKAIQIKRLVDEFISKIENPQNFKFLCRFIDTLISRSPAFRIELMLSNWFNPSFQNRMTGEIVKLPTNNVQPSEEDYQDLQEALIQSDNKRIMKLLKSRILWLFSELNPQLTDEDIEKQYDRFMDENYRSSDLLVGTMDLISPSKFTPIVLVNLTGIFEEIVNPLEFITSDLPVVALDMKINGINYRIDYFFPINPSIAIGLLDNNNFAKFYAANISTHDESKFEWYSIITDRQVVEYINKKMWENCFEYGISNHREPLLSILN